MSFDIYFKVSILLCAAFALVKLYINNGLNLPNPPCISIHTLNKHLSVYYLPGTKTYTY